MSNTRRGVAASRAGFQIDLLRFHVVSAPLIGPIISTMLQALKFAIDMFCLADRRSQSPLSTSHGPVQIVHRSRSPIPFGLVEHLTTSGFAINRCESPGRSSLCSPNLFGGLNPVFSACNLGHNLKILMLQTQPIHVLP